MRHLMTTPTLDLAGNETIDIPQFRVGGHVPLNVYERGRPIFQCHTPEEAVRIVALLNTASSIPSLFCEGDFMLHSGAKSDYKINCDVLSDVSIACLARELRKCLPTYSTVYGVPRGGLRLAYFMEPFATKGVGRVLLVDDVYTTGASMEEFRKEHMELPAIGAVLWARTRNVPDWIFPLQTFNGPDE